MSGKPERRAWGWHALSDSFARQLVADAGITDGDLVLDIGAGTGAITHHLIGAGARVIAVELHPRRAAALRERFAGDPVTVVQADAGDLYLPRRPFRVVANPPFSVTSALLHRLLTRGSRLESADVVLQRAAARRIVERGLRGGAGSGRWSLELGYPLPRRAFSPPPRVDTAVLHVRRTGAGR